MTILNNTYLSHFKALQQSYENLPWYQRAWLFLSSFWVFYALRAITEKPTIEQLNNLFEAADKAWFNNSIFFTFLNRFREAVQGLGLNGAAADSKEELSSFLSVKEVIKLASTSTTHRQFFKPILDVRRFLAQVVQGKYDKVASLLQENIQLLTQKGKVSDLSLRNFYNISGFQYALWALDKHLWIQMLECIPRNEEGVTVTKLLIEQYEELLKKGATYAFGGRKFTEQNFGFDNTIIAAMNNLIDGFNKSYEVYLDPKIIRSLAARVCLAQSFLPVAVVYEYCSEIPFNPLPEFNVPPLQNRKYYFNTRAHDWFKEQSMVMCKADKRRAKGFFFGRLSPNETRHLYDQILVDSLAIQKLHHHRAADFIELKTLLVGLLNECQERIIPNAGLTLSI
ncbi:MAG: hypothetical protein H0U70_03515 [Tatlockia sp.]|nr:hypothetical protein [Tatlockia sp.]